MATLRETTANIQQRLVDGGYDLGTFGPAGDGVDGSWGRRTADALWDYLTHLTPAHELAATLYTETDELRRQATAHTVTSGRLTVSADEVGKVARVLATGIPPLPPPVPTPAPQFPHLADTVFADLFAPGADPTPGTKVHAPRLGWHIHADPDFVIHNQDELDLACVQIRDLPSRPYRLVVTNWPANIPVKVFDVARSSSAPIILDFRLLGDPLTGLIHSGWAAVEIRRCTQPIACIGLRATDVDYGVRVQGCDDTLVGDTVATRTRHAKVTWQWDPVQRTPSNRGYIIDLVADRDRAGLSGGDVAHQSEGVYIGSGLAGPLDPSKTLTIARILTSNLMESVEIKSGPTVVNVDHVIALNYYTPTSSSAGPTGCVSAWFSGDGGGRTITQDPRINISDIYATGHGQNTHGVVTVGYGGINTRRVYSLVTRVPALRYQAAGRTSPAGSSPTTNLDRDVIGVAGGSIEGNSGHAYTIDSQGSRPSLPASAVMQAAGVTAGQYEAFLNAVRSGAFA